MSISTQAENRHSLLADELNWLESRIEARLGGNPLPPPPHPTAPWLPPASDDKELDFAVRLAAALATAPLFRPSVLDRFHQEALKRGHSVMEFGILRAEPGPQICTSLQTVIFLADCSPTQGISLRRQLQDHPWLLGQGLLAGLPGIENGQSGLFLNERGMRLLFADEGESPEHNPNFAARIYETEMAWEDLVLPKATMDRVQEILDYIQHGEQLQAMEGLGRRIAPGFRALFHGPPGTGKSLTAALLGKRSGRPVFRVDLSLVVSKYIGETEKNLAKIFDRAERTNWLLFFDEADSLFGKRTETRHSNDRYANQEVSYLLQRIEAFRGVTLLASNFRKNMDAAFSRRFQTVVEFPAPSAFHRVQLWGSCFHRPLLPHGEVDIQRLADRFPLTGAEIVNAARFAALRSLREGHKQVMLPSLLQGIAREYEKQGKVMPQYEVQVQGSY